MESMMEIEPMAVSAPDLTSALSDQASHVPIIADSPPSKSTNGNGNGQSNGKAQDSEDAEMPISRKSAPAAVKRSMGSSDEEDDKPLAKKPRASAVAGRKRRIVESESEDDDEVPIKKEKSAPSGATTARPRISQPDSSDSDLSDDAAKKPAAAKGKVAPKANGSSSGSTSKSAPSKSRTSAAASGSISASQSTTATQTTATTATTGDDSDLSEDDTPKKRSNGHAKANGKAATKRVLKKKPGTDDEESDLTSSASEELASSDDEKPLAKKAKVKAKATTPAKVRVKKNGSETPKAKAKIAKKSNGVKKEEASSDDDEVPLAKKAKSSREKGKGKEKEGKVKREKEVKDEDEDDDKHQWWLEADKDGSEKWKTLVHNGVLFPPAYIPLPKGVKMRYDGVDLTLPPEAEEVAGFWAAMLETDHVKDATFQSNFFRDFLIILKKYPPREKVKVEKLTKCDFRPMFEHFEREKEKKKSLTTAEKKQIKADRDTLEAPYLYAIVDGRKEKLGNFRAEPPGLFRGRGEHPKKGTLKYRLRPEDITINISSDAPTPIPNIPGKWKAVKQDPTVTWLAEWKENVNGNTKYVHLSAGSSWKGQSDRSKFEKARELLKHVGRIRKTYNEDLKSKIMADRQRATALYFIDELALRAGNEKGEDEADTVGCCSLRYEHVTLEPPNKVTFDFLGKDSMRFLNTVVVSPQIFKNVKIFKADKEKGDQLFDRLTTGILNKYLNDFMPGLSAKVFRTYNASHTFQQQLRKLTPANGSVAEKIAAYNDANRDVAILCNHQKTVSKNFAESFAKMGDKVRALKYQRMKLRFQLFTLEPKTKNKKKHPDLIDDESDMDNEFMERHEEEVMEKAMEAAKKKFEKENIKLEEAKEDVKPQKALKDRLDDIREEFEELAKERKSRKVEPRKGATEEKLLEQISKMDGRIAVAKTQMGDRDKTKDVALGTSKINYIDPRLTVAWAKKFDVPLEKLFSKTLREKFPWAEAEADEDWVF